MTRRAVTYSLRAALAGAVLMGATVTHAGSARADACADRGAREALEMRVLQSELMVAALTCNQRGSYNAFVTGFKPYLRSQGRELRSFFAKTFGPSAGPQRLNKLVTRLANTASQNSLGQPTNAFCAAAQRRFDAVLSASPQMLAKLARTSPTAKVHGFKSCVEVAESEGAKTPGQN